MQQFLEIFPYFFELLYNGPFILIITLLKLDFAVPFFRRETLENLIEFQKETIPLVFFFTTVVNYLKCKSADQFLRKHLFTLLIFFASLIVWGDVQFTYWFTIIHWPTTFSLLLKRKHRRLKQHIYLQSPFTWFKLPPSQLVIITFLLPILLGTTLLMLPISSSKASTVHFIDALFMTTAATCVTGLSTISISNDLSSFGQFVMLGLIQIGGLGIMILYASMTMLLGRSLAMKERIVIQDVMDITGLEDFINAIFAIIKYTFVIEFWGTIILTIGLIFEGLDFGRAFYYGLFYAVSAFCNSGHGPIENSLENYATSPLILCPIIILVTLGGLGFSVLKKTKEAVIDKRGFKVFDVHSKIVLVTSLVLTLSAAIIIFFGEYLNVLDQYSLGEKILISLFQSTTLRTAGFHVLSISNFHPYTLYMMIMYMFIGASPGSTGGGIKTTTFAVLIQSVRSSLNGKDRVEFFKRSIPPLAIVKSTAITITSIILTTLAVFLLMKVESQQSFLSLYFEVVSAFATVGLSLGTTSSLSFMGKFIIILMMFIGRVGPLTLVLAIGQKTMIGGNYQYPDGRIVVG